jgi:hypothetical protein
MNFKFWNKKKTLIYNKQNVPNSIEMEAEKFFKCPHDDLLASNCDYDASGGDYITCLKCGIQGSWYSWNYGKFSSKEKYIEHFRKFGKYLT